MYPLGSRIYPEAEMIGAVSGGVALDRGTFAVGLIDGGGITLEGGE